MQVQLHTDPHIAGGSELLSWLQTTVTKSLQRFEPRLTGVEVHLGDENAAKTGDRDTRCTMEARLAGAAPLVATHHGPDMHQAIQGALARLERSLDDHAGRQQDRQRRP